MTARKSDVESTPSADGQALPASAGSARRMFSLPLSDHALADFVEQQGAKHRKGVAGYLRHLVTMDRQKWLDMAQLRELALSKLTDNERAALGYPPNVGSDLSCPTGDSHNTQREHGQD